MNMDIIHNWILVGEDTGGFIYWCSVTGAIKDSGGDIQYPKSFTL